MPPKFVLNRLLEIAASSAESAAASLGALNRQLQQQEEKLVLLFKYRDEYRERLRRAERSGLDGAKLRNFHEFLDRLEQAIVQQHAQVVDARARMECGRNDWHLKQRKSKAFGTLSQRFNTATQRDQATREQKLQDDFASRTHRVAHQAPAHAAAGTAKNRR
jgi:flagellar FliJ protein